MRIEKFCKELKKHVYLGEYISDICFIKINEHFTPAVLCMNIDITETDITYKAVQGIIYWDNNKKIVIRKNIPYETQVELRLPIKETISFDEKIDDAQNEIEQSEDEQKKYYILMEKICCALEVGCVTPYMKQAYTDMIKLKNECEIKRVLSYFFPEAAEQLLN